MPVSPAPLESIRIGEVRIRWLPDGVGRFKATAFIQPTTDEDWGRHPEAVDADGMMIASLGGALVETPGNIVLIDLGIGERKLEIPIGSAEGGQFLQSLAAAGVSPHRVDTVVSTHLHADHVGWSSSKTDDVHVLRDLFTSGVEHDPDRAPRQPAGSDRDVFESYPVLLKS